MFLYLSSQGLGPSPHLLAEHARGRRALVVANAIDDLARAQRDRLVADEVGQVSRLGFDVDELDLRAYFEEPVAVAPVIAAADLLWVIGGNTFTLCRALAASGAARPIVDGVARGLVYAGYSAGVVAAGPDLVAIDLVDDPSTCPDAYPVGIEPITLRLVDERVIPHVDPSGSGRGLMGPVVERLHRGGHAHVLLSDDQVLVVRGARRWVESA